MIQGAAETATVMPPGSHGVIAKHHGIAVGKKCEDDPIHAVSHWGWFIALGLPHYDGFQQTLASKISKQVGNSL